MKKTVIAILLAAAAMADSVDIDFDHPDMSRRGWRIYCSDLLGEPRVIVDFDADISTWGDVWTINVKSNDPGSPAIDVTGASKRRVRGTFSFDLKAGNHPLEIVVTKTSGRTFSDIEAVEIVDDTNGTCPL